MICRKMLPSNPPSSSSKMPMPPSSQQTREVDVVRRRQFWQRAYGSCVSARIPEGIENPEYSTSAPPASTASSSSPTTATTTTTAVPRRPLLPLALRSTNLPALFCQ